VVQDFLVTWCLISKPTRVAASSSTIIDHTMTNDVVHKLHSSVILSDLTDHYPIVCIIDKFEIVNFNNHTSMYRDRKKLNKEAFCD